jgi:hypothetical protein
MEKNSGVFILDRIWKNGFTEPKNARDVNLLAPVISMLSSPFNDNHQRMQSSDPHALYVLSLFLKAWVSGGLFAGGVENFRG